MCTEQLLQHGVPSLDEANEPVMVGTARREADPVALVEVAVCFSDEDGAAVREENARTAEIANDEAQEEVSDYLGSGSGARRLGNYCAGKVSGEAEDILRSVRGGPASFVGVGGGDVERPLPSRQSAGFASLVPRDFCARTDGAVLDEGGQFVTECTL